MDGLQVLLSHNLRKGEEVACLVAACYREITGRKI